MPSNPRLIVELFRDKYFQGTRAVVVEPVEDLSVLGLENTVSSIKVYQGPGGMVTPNMRALFYEEREFRGRRLVLAPGFYPDIHAIPYNFGDQISSITFSPSAPLTAPRYGWIPVIIEVFQDLNYQGRTATILRDISYFGEIGLNDAISSLRITRGPNFPFTGCQVLFFQHADYEGRTLELVMSARDFTIEIPNLHDYPQHFGDIISSAKILPTATFRVLVVEGDSATREPAILSDYQKLQNNTFEFTHIKINANLDNRGSPDAIPFSEVVPELPQYDILWFTWNAPGHDREYFLKPSDERAIREWVKAGGTLWCSAVDDNIIAEGEYQGQWKGDWLPVDRHPAKVVNSEDVKIWMTREGRKTGLFTWPNVVDLDRIQTDDHWITTDPTYVVLARRDDNQEPVALQLPYGDGHYILFAIDTRDDARGEAARPLIENALCYLASLAWATSPRQPLRGRARFQT